MKQIILWTLAVVIICGGILLAVKKMNTSGVSSVSGQYDVFAKCLKESGAIFYGAFWCPHCQDQKKEFGDSSKFLPYVECSTLDSRGQTLVCKEKGITSYPTWIFKDGSSLTGKVTWKVLAEKTACALPVDIATSTSATQ